MDDSPAVLMSPPAWTSATEVWLATPDAAVLFDPARLSGTDRDAWAGIRTPRRRLDWASSRALLSAVPVNPDQASSLSHSHGFAALARASGTVALGVDLEWLAPRDFRSMADTAYSAAESGHLSRLDDPFDLCATFYQFWTLKEAFAKALRLPLADALKQCCFVDPSGARCTTVPTTKPWRATVFAPRPQLRLALVRVTAVPGWSPDAILTMEWPQPCGKEWPVVLDLESGGDFSAC